MRKIYFIFKHYIKKFLRFFYAFLCGGEECVICGGKTYVNPVCKKCASLYFSIEGIFDVKRCKICGKEIISSNGMCLECREKIVTEHVDYLLPLFSYRGWNKELMFIWKSMEIRSLSEFFAKIVNKVLKKLEINTIVPVPPRKGKIKEKGWDQIDELCSFLHNFYGYRILKILGRESTKQQKKLNREERLLTIGKAYYLKKGKEMERAIKQTGGKIPSSICLIDDVCTTGATIEGCAKILKEAGVENVKVITLFSVD